jgi:sugar lactone lactonase YvrE
MTMTRVSTVVLSILTLAACKPKPSEPARTEPEPARTEPAKAEPAKAEAPPPADADKLTLEGFATPESVLHDPAADVYLVSNINGKPLDADDNGFISRVTPDGKIAELKWIDGAKDDVKLDAPKGSAIVGDVLWVADITVVRKFDMKTGKALGEVAIPGATFLNDVAADATGIWVTDSGLNASFEPTGTDAVYRIEADGKLTTLVKDKALGAPNGLAATAAGLHVVTFGSGERYLVAAEQSGKHARDAGEKVGGGQLDGVIVVDDQTVLVSSWKDSAVYMGKPAGPWAKVVDGLESPADIGWDARRKRVLVPLFMKDTVVILRVQK